MYFQFNFFMRLSVAIKTMRLVTTRNIVASNRLAMHIKLAKAQSAQDAIRFLRYSLGIVFAINRNIQLLAMPVIAQPLGLIEAISDMPNGMMVNVNPVSQLKYFLFVQRMACEKNRREAIVALNIRIARTL